jgi:Ribonuclease G/E
MPGHHRIKAGDRAASAAVDFAEAVADPDGEFPFEAVTAAFGPREGDRVRLVHGKPDGRAFALGRAEVRSVAADGTVTVEREMSPGGTYDALGVERRAGDVAVTKLTEGKWWYPTVYRSSEGERRGTYVNVCTPVEVFPDAVRYVDLHVDVVKHADGTVERVDDDELDAAVEAGNVPSALAEKARAVAGAVENAL